jgi:hypothetical protein
MSGPLPYSEGDAFGIPLEGGDWALGVVSRAAPGGRVVIGHFFGPRRHALPEGGELPDLKPENAVAVERFGDLGLFDGSWPVLGRVTGWRREDWPAPAFRRVDVVSGAVRRVMYDDADPAEEIAAERVRPAEAEGLPNDGLQGALGMTRLIVRLLP